MDWFRSHHGAPTDPKWVTIAKRSETQPVVSCALWWALMDYASQHEDRGSIAGFDTETIAVFFGVDEAVILRVLEAMREKGLITDDRLTAWEKRQPVREDNSTERVRAFRQRKATEGNTTERKVTQRNARVEKRREEKIEQKQQQPLRVKRPRAVRGTAAPTWLTPALDAWAKHFGPGSLDPRKAAGILSRLKDAGVATDEIGRMIHHLAERDIGVLITDHKARELLGIVDRAYVIESGRVLAEGDVAEIVGHEDVRRVYLGEEFRL